MEAAMPGPHLVLDAVRLAYPSSRGVLPALDGVSLTLRRGEFVSILGPSGCGKSSLLRLVSGLMPVGSGAIHLAGSPVTGPRPDVGIVFQQPTLLPWRTVLDNVLVPIRARRRPSAADTAKASALLDLVGLQAFARHYPHELSGGMQQRVGIARGLITQPDLLLMDEPFAALDAMTRETMMDELQRIWVTTGTSVLFITHSIPEAVYLSDRVLVMGPRPGRIVLEAEIDLPRPRTLDVMGAARFAELSARLRATIRGQDGAP